MILSQDGGLYLQLYQCLQAIVYSLHEKVHSITTHMDIQQSTYVYIYMYVCIYVCMYVYMYNVCMYVCMFVCLYNVCNYVCTCVCMYVYIYICNYESVYGIFSYISISLLRPTPTFSTTSSTLFTSSRKSSLSSSQYTHQRCLLASEVVHLMCLVPTFFDLLDSNKGPITI